MFAGTEKVRCDSAKAEVGDGMYLAQAFLFQIKKEDYGFLLRGQGINGAIERIVQESTVGRVVRRYRKGRFGVVYGIAMLRPIGLLVIEIEVVGNAVNPCR